ncbi:pilin [Candidatus Gracilibacteria bacterium]|nr:pilin [Candidatus Gracilibacteria bacterium]MCF7856795.1 pilin [Candidatus Gracilibacteria bacterium]MCF7897073.1 pilin [Candidatus Gracilibacteria bacterium]
MPKLQKLLTLLLVLPLCAVLFNGVVRAEITCEGALCGELLVSQTELYQAADELHKAFSECLSECGIYDYGPDWDTCKADLGEEKDKSCKEIADLAYEKTGETDYYARQEKLSDLRILLGRQKSEIQQIMQSRKAVDASRILSITGQTTFTDAKEFLGKVIDLLVKMVGLVALVFLVIGGFRLVAAAGNDNEIQKAKTMITYSIIGLAFTLLAYLIVAAVQGILYR